MHKVVRIDSVRFLWGLCKAFYLSLFLKNLLNYAVKVVKDFGDCEANAPHILKREKSHLKVFTADNISLSEQN